MEKDITDKKKEIETLKKDLSAKDNLLKASTKREEVFKKQMEAHSRQKS